MSKIYFWPFCQQFQVGLVACHTAVTVFSDQFARFLQYLQLTLSQVLVAQKQLKQEQLNLSEYRL